MEQRRRVERITDMIRRAVGIRYTGKLTISFRGGTPTSLFRESHHGEDDGWDAFPEEQPEIELRGVADHD